MFKFLIIFCKRNRIFHFISELPEVLSHRKSITVNSKENSAFSIEDQLRNLLRKECEKNERLSVDYRKLQKRNVELVTEMKKVKQENEKLVMENDKLKNTYSYIPLEHDYGQR